MDFDALNDRFPVTQVIESYGIRVRHGSFLCPFHDDDTTPGSGSVYTVNGREQWKCHAASCAAKGGDSVDFVQEKEGCTRWQAIERLTGQSPPRPEGAPKPKPKPKLKLVRNLVPFPKEHGFRPGTRTPDILSDRSGKRRAWTPQLVHQYKNQRGEVMMITCRIIKGDGGKVVLPVRFDAHDGPVTMGWQEGENRLLYNEPYLRLRPDDPVLLIEGEKCVDAVKALEQFKDYIVLTWQGGAENHRHQPWEKLKGRRVTIWPDADLPKAGKEEGGSVIAARAIAQAVQPAEVRVVWPLQEWIDQDIGYDVLDLIAATSADEARQVMENLATPWEGEGDGNDEPPEPPEPPPPPGRDGEPLNYSRNKDGDLSVSSQRNWWTYVSRDPRFGHTVAFDTFDKIVLLDGQPISDYAVWRITEEMETRASWRGVNLDRLGPMLLTLARESPVNRLADELRELGKTWDGTERHLLDYAGADVGSEWAAIAGWRWFLGHVKRMLEPGCKHDLVLVLEGRQGIGKSMFFETLGQVCGRNLYTDLAKLTQDKDTQLKLVGKAVVELAEMTAHRQGDTDALKGMITATTDRYRLPYARETIDVPRTCVFCGTTNEEQYLKDLTGNRRYLIVEVTRPADIEALRRELPQLLAEAVVALERGELNRLTAEEEKLQAAAAKPREIEWPQLARLEDHLDAGTVDSPVSRDKLWGLAGFEPHQRHSNPVQAALTRMMKDRGWESYNTGKQRLWRRKLDPDTP